MELLILHAAATLVLTGIIWFVQLVHYPLFELVGASEFPAYERRHARQTGWIVGPLMLVELITGVLLIFRQPDSASSMLAWIGISLIAVIWLSTVLLHVPCHRRLEARFSPDIHHKLVTTNWLRTVSWSLRGIIVCLMITFNTLPQA